MSDVSKPMNIRCMAIDPTDMKIKPAIFRRHWFGPDKHSINFGWINGANHPADDIPYELGDQHD